MVMMVMIIYANIYIKIGVGNFRKKNQVTMVHSIAVLLFKITLVQMQRRILSSE